MIRTIIKDTYLETWKGQLINHSEGKLQTYIKFKSSHGVKSYLSLINNFELRRNLTKFRVSSHHLRIESGRYQGILPHLRTCEQCDSCEVEDDIHFLFCCNKFSGDRHELYDIITNACHNFKNFNNQEKYMVDGM